MSSSRHSLAQVLGARRFSRSLNKFLVVHGESKPGFRIEVQTFAALTLSSQTLLLMLTQLTFLAVTGGASSLGVSSLEGTNSS